jgi:ParB/RepB/Spo0J family partition protein
LIRPRPTAREGRKDFSHAIPDHPTQQARSVPGERPQEHQGRHEGLAANITAQGLLSNLIVRATDGGKFEIVAGGRRLAALKHLAKTEKQDEDKSQIPCSVIEGDEDAHEISLPENEMRAAMHPDDQFEAFKKLADEGQGNDTIAAKFGVTPCVVEQRLKLAVVSRKLIKAYRDEKMILEHLMAFTFTDDHKAVSVWPAPRGFIGLRGFRPNSLPITHRHHDPLGWDHPTYASSGRSRPVCRRRS